MIVELKRQEVIERVKNRFHLEEALQPFEAYRLKSTTMDYPVLHLEDITGIPFVSGVAGVMSYQHRARVRAGNNDLFAAMSYPASGYEEYCQQVLNLGAPQFVKAEPGEYGTMAVAKACMEGEAFDVLCKRTIADGGMVIHPYMSIESTWNLARALAQKTNMPVSVFGPPPPTLWLANDKSWLAFIISELLGDDWMVETHRAINSQDMVTRLSELAAQHAMVGLKRTRCASAMGNIVYDSAKFLALLPDERHKDVAHFLQRTEWSDSEEVLIVEWAQTDLSPSTQLWIPALGEGDPYCEGVYEQILEGTEKFFVGSRPSTLPIAVNNAMIRASLEVAKVFQGLGYIGRCSFDFIVVGDIHGEFQAKFTECNGRWGGTSTPMRLVDRLFDTERPSYIAQDYIHPDLVGMPFEELLARVGKEVFNPSSGQGRFIFYNVGPLEEFGKFDVVSLGQSPADAQAGVKDILPTLLGL